MTVMVLNPLGLLANSVSVSSVFATFVLELRCLYCKHLCFLSGRVGNTERSYVVNYIFTPFISQSGELLGHRDDLQTD